MIFKTAKMLLINAVKEYEALSKKLGYRAFRKRISSMLLASISIKRPYYGAVLAAMTAALFLGGCTDLSKRTLPGEEPTELLPGFELTSSSETRLIVDISEDEGDGSETYSEYPFTAEDEEYLAQTIFVGDNLCLGLSSLGIVRSDNIIADEEATANNITEIPFRYGGGNIDVLAALVNSDPETTVFTLGSNYMGIEDSEAYCDKYMSFISLARTYCPNSEFIILSAPPVNKTSVFVDNEIIKNYNTALKQAVESLNDAQIKYIDIGTELGNSGGELKTNYGSGDRSLLTERGYYAVLWQICNGRLI